MRHDLLAIDALIEPGSRVLDLGCGEGDLLAHLAATKDVRGAGIEIDEDKVARGIARGLSVLHGDVNLEAPDYPDGMFDYVILSQTLQQVYDPARLIREMLRIGRRGVVSFPNFGHYRLRLSLLASGRAPKSRELPYEWFDTPNIRVVTIKDFRIFCKKSGFRVLSETAVGGAHHHEKGRTISFLPNLFATYGIYLLGR